MSLTLAAVDHTPQAADALVDEIAEQLRSEIRSLEEHIQRTESRYLASQWAGELIEPFEDIESDLEGDELRNVILAFHHARTRFQVNGHLADRIDAILGRHADLVAEFVVSANGAPTELGYEEVVLPPDADPGDTTVTDEAGSLFQEEDEELADETSPADEPAAFVDDGALFSEAEVAAAAAPEWSGEDEDENGSAPTVDWGPADDDQEPPARSLEWVGDDELPESAAGPSVLGGTVEDAETVDDLPPLPGTADADGLFGAEVAATATETPRPESSPGTPPAPADGSESEADDLFQTGEEQPDASTAPAPASARQEDPRSAKLARSAEEAELYSIFAHRVTVDDLMAGMGVDLPAEDKAGLQNRLRSRLEDRVVASLRGSKLAEGQYVLLPRIQRFVTHSGSVVPCTVKNLAKHYIGLFGDIRDLMRYRNDALMSSDVPEPGWALVTAESPRESLGKNYMEQNQYLRYLSTTLGIPSHLVRRRTMVESIYDLIVGQLALGEHFQRATLDWTSSSPSKNDFVCVYYPEEGIRVRDLSRITHHRSLGITPSW